MIVNTTKSETDTLPTLRKAAMLLIVLGEQISADILQHLSEDDVQKVSREVAQITAISAEQAELVLNEFHQITTAGTYVARGGVEYARKVLMRAFAPKPPSGCSIGWPRPWAPKPRPSTPSRKPTRSSSPSSSTTSIPKRSHWCSRTSIPVTGGGSLIFTAPSIRSDVALRMASLDQISPEIILKIAGIIGQKLKALGRIQP